MLFSTNNLIKHQSFLYTQLNDQTVLIQTIQFSISTQSKCQTVLFDPEVGLYQVLPLSVSMDLGAVATKGYSEFFKISTLSFLPRCSRCIRQPQLTRATGLSLGESYPSAEMQSVYSAAPADWATWQSLGESYPSAEMQSVYSAAPADLAPGRSLRES